MRRRSPVTAIYSRFLLAGPWITGTTCARSWCKRFLQAPRTRGMRGAAWLNMASLLRRHRIICFLVITYAVTWGAWIPLAVTGYDVTIGFEPWYLIGLLGPLIGALATTALVTGRPGLRDLVSRM